MEERRQVFLRGFMEKVEVDFYYPRQADNKVDTGLWRWKPGAGASLSSKWSNGHPG